MAALTSKELTHKHCSPYEGDLPAISRRAAVTQLKKLPGLATFACRTADPEIGR